MKFGLCVASVAHAALAREMGYDGYEFSGAELAVLPAAEVMQLRRLTEQLTFPCFGINAFSPGVPALVGPEHDPERTQEYFDLVCGRAHMLGARNIGIGAPKARVLPEGYDRTLADRQMQAFLSCAADKAAEYGMNILVESLRPQSCNYINTTAQALDMIQSCGRKNVRMVYDFYHVKEAEEPALLRFSQVVNYVEHVHLSTNEGGALRGYPADRKEYGAIVRTMQDAGYDGTVSIEPSYFETDPAAQALVLLKQCAAGR